MGVGRITGKYGTEFDQPPVDRSIAALAARQHGVVSLEQLRHLGLTASTVRKRHAAGKLHRIHRGVYAVGHTALTREGHWMAAVLAGGDGAVLSHRDAAALLGLRPNSRSRIEITVPRRSPCSRPGLQIHRCSLPPQDVTVVDGIPCTTVARTVLDLAEELGRRPVERLIEQAERLRLFDRRALDDTLGRSTGRRGAAIVTAIFSEYEFGDPPTRNDLEEAMFGICSQAGLPKPRVNLWIPLEDDGVEADFAWPKERLIAETDGRDTHGTHAAFERDRARDRRLMRAGWRVARFTWREVMYEPERVAEDLRALLALARGSATAGRRAAA